jgi:hypothetical protein
MLDDTITINDYNNNNQKEIKSPNNNKRLLSHTQIIKSKNEKMTYDENMEDVSSNNLKNEVRFQFNPLLGPNKRRISKTTFGKNISKKIKKVTLDNPFISIVNVESFKDYNLKMTYNEYESIPDINKTNRACPCKNPICLIF